MGNCQSSKHVRVSDGEGEDSKYAYNIRGGDVTDSTESDRDADTGTLPLTPYSKDDFASPASGTTSSNKASHHKASKEGSPPVVSPASWTSELSSSKNTRQGRALRARLEKSRSLQASLSNPNKSNEWNDDASSSETSVYRYSMSFDVLGVGADEINRTNNNATNQEFDASISQGTVWAELDNVPGDKALAVTLSRQQPTLTCPSPPLYLGVGTELGTVSIMELLDETTSITADRFGKSLRFQCEGRVRALDFSPDGQYLALGGDDCICTVLKLVHTGSAGLAQLQVCAEFERVDRVYAVKFSPDGRYLAIGGFDGAVAIAATQDIADSYTPDLVAEILGDGLVFSLDWSPDAQYLAFGGSDRVCSIVDTKTSWHVAHKIRCPAVIKTLRWNLLNGHFLAIGSSNVMILEAPEFTVHKEFEIPATADGAKSKTRINALCWSPNGSYLIVCDSDKCRVVETKSFATVQEIKRSGEINSVHWGQKAPIGGVPRRYLVIGDNDKVALLKAGIEVNDGTSTFGDDISTSMASSMFSYSTRGDGANRADEWVLQDDIFRDIEGDMTFSETPAVKVLAVAFSRGSRSKDSTYFAYASDDGLVTIKSSSDCWKTLAELRFPQPVTNMYFSNGSRYLAFGCLDSKIYVSATAPRWSLLSTTKLSSPAKAIIYSKDNSFLAAGTGDGSFLLMDSKLQYEIVGSIDDNESAVAAVDWCSKTLAIGRNDGTVQLYDTNEVVCGYYVSLGDIKRRSQIRSVAFGLSGRFLAVGTNDGIVGVYSAKGGWVLCHQLRSNGGISSLRWSPTSSFLAVSDDREGMKLLDTVFWQDVDEASKAFATGRGNGGVPLPSNLGPSCMCFSQNGRLLALSQSHSGVSVVDTLDWKFSFSVNDQKHKDSESVSLLSFDVP